jgi:DNA primase
VAPVVKQLEAPAGWDELEEIYPTDLTLDTVPDRLESAGDPWAGMLEARQDLAEVLGLRRAG